MEILQRRVLVGGIIGLLLVTLLFIFLFYLPKVRQTSKIEKEISSLRKQVKENEAMERDLGKLRIEIDRLENQQQEFMSKVIPRSEMLVIVRELIKMGEPYKLVFKEIQPPGLDTIIKVDKSESPLQAVPFLFTVQGKFLDIAQYLEVLRDFPYFIRTPEIEIISKDEIRPMVEVRVLMNLFVSSLVAGSKI